jgi:NAD(P)-dependent dehydrogenase (short-subunit alcohol dehydrogenase family)
MKEVYTDAVELHDKVIVITGGARGIGRAMVRRFAAENPRKIVVADQDLAGAEEAAREVDGLPIGCDVAREAEIVALVERAEAEAGPVDLFCANAGIAVAGGVERPDDEWRRVLDVNFMSHVWTARALVPRMLARGGGYLLATASAAGLLTAPGAAAYSVSKHAVVALAEWLSMTHGDQGLRVSCLCPQYVNTDMLRTALTSAAGASIAASGPVLEPEGVADAVVAGIAAERFLILPHEEVATYFQRKAGDYDRWLAAMRKLDALREGGE